MRELYHVGIECPANSTVKGAGTHEASRSVVRLQAGSQSGGPCTRRLHASIATMRRSEQHESEIARLVGEGARVAETDTTHMDESREGNESPSVTAKHWRKSRSVEPSPNRARISGAADGRQLSDSTSTSTRYSRYTNDIMSSTPSNQRSSLYTMTSPAKNRATSNEADESGEVRNFRYDHPDFGDEYLQDDAARRIAALSLRSPARTPRSERSVTAPASTRRQRGMAPVEQEPMDPHTQNLRLALDQLERIPHISPDLVQQLGEAARLAEAVNHGLRHTIRESLEVQMSLALRPTNDPTEGLVSTVDMNLSELLKHSDDHVRSLTDTLITLGREQRELRRSEPARFASPQRAALDGREKFESPRGMQPDLHSPRRTFRAERGFSPAAAARAPRYASSPHASLGSRPLYVRSPREPQSFSSLENIRATHGSGLSPRQAALHASRQAPLSTPTVFRSSTESASHRDISTATSPTTPPFQMSPLARGVRAGRLTSPPESSYHPTDRL